MRIGSDGLDSKLEGSCDNGWERGSCWVKSLCARDTFGVWNYDWRSGGVSG